MKKSILFAFSVLLMSAAASIATAKIIPAGGGSGPGPGYCPPPFIIDSSGYCVHPGGGGN